MLIRALRKAEGAHDLEELDEVLRLPLESWVLIELLVGLPKSEDILSAPTKFAARLSELRKIPRWW